MITLLLLIPIIGSMLLLPINNNELRMKQIALTTSLINLFISLFIWYQFDSNITQYQFVSDFSYLNLYHLNFGVDSISIYFVLLTTFVTPIALLSNYTTITNNLKYFLISFLILESLQICAFVSLDLLLFYIFFESAKWSGLSLLCFKLSNSGDSLKLMIPNYSWKAISGWSNYSGKVTSHKMSENEMGNRGSKSIKGYKSLVVKEQRVDGSYFGSILYPELRCTLMGGESNYQISNPSNQFIIQTKTFYTHSPLREKLIHHSLMEKTQNSLPLQPKGAVIKPSLRLDPWNVTGFTDAEGCFGLYIYKNTALKIGWYVFLDFKITLHERDKDILDQIQNYFGVGSVFNHSEQSKQYGLKSIKDLQIIIAHFDKFPLITQKINDYRLFKRAFDIIINKEHLTKEGLDKLIQIKCSMNKGLPSELVVAFPQIKNLRSVIIKEAEPNKILDPNWLSGFASGEGSFQVDIKKNKTGYEVVLRFSIGQQARDEQLLRSIIDYLNCGRVQKKINKKYNKEYFEFRVEKFADIDTKIIPFFVKYTIVGQKLLDFQDFCKVAKLMKEKAHITIEGLNEIRKIKERMNTARSVNTLEKKKKFV